MMMMNNNIKSAIILVNGNNSRKMIKHLKEVIFSIEEELYNHPDTSGINWTSWDFSVELHDKKIDSLHEYILGYADQYQNNVNEENKKENDEETIWIKRTLTK
jgi:hypothetical protein